MRCAGSCARERPGGCCAMTSRGFEIVYQQTQRWLAAGCFEAFVHDLRMLLRALVGPHPQPSAAILDARTMQSSRESGGTGRAGYDGHKRRQGSKVHAAVDTLGHRLALVITPANAQERAQVARLAGTVHEATGDHIELAYVDQGDTGAQPAQEADAHGIRFAVVKLLEAKRGFGLLPRHWVVERSVAWMARCRSLARDDECLPSTLAGLHFVAVACLMLHQLFQFFSSPSHALARR